MALVLNFVIVGNMAAQIGEGREDSYSQFFSPCGLGVNYYAVLNHFMSSETLLNCTAVVLGVSEGAVMILEVVPPGASRTVLTDAYLLLLTCEMFAYSTIHRSVSGGRVSRAVSQATSPPLALLCGRRPE